MNQVILAGRISRKFELQEFGKKEKTQVLTFVIACQKTKEDADFITIKAFNRTASLIDDFCGVGDQIIITGHIQTGSYDNDDGDTIYTQDIICDRMEFGAKKQETGKGGKKKG